MVGWGGGGRVHLAVLNYNPSLSFLRLLIRWLGVVGVWGLTGELRPTLLCSQRRKVGGWLSAFPVKRNTTTCTVHVHRSKKHKST